MPKRKRLLFVVNPNAGKSAIRNQLLQIVDIFIAAGYSVNIHTSQRPGEIPRLVRDVGENYDMLVCSGGDGTVNETINGLMGCARKPMLGYIPAGTTNDFASTFKIPRNMVAAAEVIVSGVPTFFDVGRFNQQYFSYVAAFGAFTDVTYQTPQEYKNILGKMAYILEGVARLPEIRPYRIRVEHDDGVIDDDVLVGIITNSSYVAGQPLGKLIDSSMSDGIMEAFFIRNPNTVLELAPLINTFLAGEIDREHIHVVRTRKLRFSCAQPVSWSLDGEYGGESGSVNIENLHCALRLMVPEESVSI